ncbi:MAG: linear amide C-N hydrolase [Clostridiales bacterium]|jgi:choloylglycine hydrolase|nr:linear amide C-N hydrolase [Clostridiales bacterium]
MPCTAVGLKTEDGKSILARTMDFSGNYEATLIVVPRLFPQPLTQETVEKLPYSYVGMGVVAFNSPNMLDGLNEHGLAGVNNYYNGLAVYNKKAEPGKTPVTGYMALSYALSTCKSLDEVEDAFKNKITLVESSSPVLKVDPPLHFMFTDKSGEAVVIEPDQDGVKIYRNSVGVLTNPPAYSWHETNLRHFLGISRYTPQAGEIGDKMIEPLGGGGLGLPGDFSSVSRFIRMAYMRKLAFPAKSEDDGVTLAMHLLDSVNVIKGTVAKSPDSPLHYTFYKSAMCAESGRYFFSHYNDRRLSVATLGRFDLDAEKLVTIPWSKGQDVRDLNA